MILLLCTLLRASTLGVPTFDYSSRGMTISIASQQEEGVRVRSIEKGCLYFISNSSFIVEGMQGSQDERVRFIQKKNNEDDAQLLVGFTESWKCLKPSYRNGSFMLPIAANQEAIVETKVEPKIEPEIEIDNASEDVEPLPIPIQKREKKKNEDYLIAVDAGHGGWDAGAVGSTGLREADVVYSIALLLKEKLQSKGYQVLFIREGDVFVPLKKRAQIANEASADLFLSIHANAAPTSTLHGIETFSMDTASDDGAKKVAKRENALVQLDKEKLDSLQGSLAMQGSMRLSKMLARLVQKNVMDLVRSKYDTIETRDLGAKTALFYVLVYTKMPSILFEASFLSNPSDERQLRTPHFQQVLVDGLVSAIDEYIILQE